MTHLSSPYGVLKDHKGSFVSAEITCVLGDVVGQAVGCGVMVIATRSVSALL